MAVGENPLKPSKYDWLDLFGTLAVVLFTQRWLSVWAGIDFLMATDSQSYLQIAQAAPHLPTIVLPYHHAQRFFFPWLFGSIFQSLPPEWVLRIASCTILAATAYVWTRLMAYLNPSRSLRLLAGLLFFWNPYTYRYYLLAPAILPDQAFQLGLVTFLWGLFLWTRLNRGGGIFILGALICGLSRQTSLLMVPGLFWLGLRVRKPAVFLIPILIFFGGYGITGDIAQTFASPNANLDHILGLGTWIFSEGFSLTGLIEHLLRAFLPVLPVLVFLFFEGIKKPRRLREQGPFFLIWLGLFLQPILAGPQHSTGNGSRLAVLSLSVLIFIWVQSVDRELSKLSKRITVALLAGLSLHHMYSRVGPPSVSIYVAIQGALVLALLILFSATMIPAKSQNRKPF